MSVFWGLAYLSVTAAVAAAVQAGLIFTGDAFFLVASIVAIFTGHAVVVISEGQGADHARGSRMLPVAASYAACFVVLGALSMRALSLV
ncbi:MAG TPA: hypothetical protein DCL48_10270 [Alphaproteobacteria bacterium]|nr:hypothetical protein [Alphaproteobacteria bacterium]